jgi:hypothetical protein
LLNEKLVELENTKLALQVDPDNSELLEAVSTAQQVADAANSNLESLEPVTLNDTYINKYSEVIDYFKGDGTLTAEGIE